MNTKKIIDSIYFEMSIQNAHVTGIEREQLYRKLKNMAQNANEAESIFQKIDHWLSNPDPNLGPFDYDDLLSGGSTTGPNGMILLIDLYFF